MIRVQQDRKWGLRASSVCEEQPSTNKPSVAQRSVCKAGQPVPCKIAAPRCVAPRRGARRRGTAMRSSAHRHRVIHLTGTQQDCKRKVFYFRHWGISQCRKIETSRFAVARRHRQSFVVQTPRERRIHAVTGKVADAQTRTQQCLHGWPPTTETDAGTPDADATSRVKF